MKHDKVKDWNKISTCAISAPIGISIALCVYLLISTIKASKKYYYKIINPFFSYIIYVVIIIRMSYILLTSVFFIIFNPDNDKKIIPKMIDILFIRSIENIAIYTRIASIKKELINYQRKINKSSKLQGIKFKEYQSEKSIYTIKIHSNYNQYTLFIVECTSLLILLIFCVFPFSGTDNFWIYSY